MPRTFIKMSQQRRFAHNSSTSSQEFVSCAIRNHRALWRDARGTETDYYDPDNPVVWKRHRAGATLAAHTLVALSPFNHKNDAHTAAANRAVVEGGRVRLA
jgi:hypothetical protein